ncbi:hypothetical protein LVD15_12085 [Fulvivirga maritima]|uniref:hypothetical protein n=1 Tax=Fulvivirga maritima TaxID=2904247 RepID=UPI001F17E2E7|nr:hypothetical protein [Fulvivirga maritima]UII29134.1 hypothetical protein LVD15_12085 [Fulvivirga maritima]
MKFKGLLIVFCLLFIGCVSDKERHICMQESVVLLCHSLQSKVDIIDKNIMNDNNRLHYLLEEMKNKNYYFIDQAGGFKPGTGLILMDPCRSGEVFQHILAEFKVKDLMIAYVDALESEGIVSSERKLDFVYLIDSFWCNEGCPFSRENYEYQNYGSLVLQFYTLELAILEMTLIELN